MFYVTDTKVYLAEFNETLGMYPEVKFVDGRAIVQKTGSQKKPPVKMVCSLSEILAKFGRNFPAASAPVSARSSARTVKPDE